MADPVNMTMFRAADGSLHESEALAKVHDVYLNTNARIASIVEIIERDFSFIMQCNASKAWETMDDWDRHFIIEQFAREIYSHNEAIAAACVQP